MTRAITRRSEVEGVLDDPRYRVAPVPAGTDGIAWLRSDVCRFANGETHARRRALVEAELARLDPVALARGARERTGRALDRAGACIEVMAELARPVPLAVLCEALGLDESTVDDAVTAATLVGGAYLTGEQGIEIDAAVELLARAFARGTPERTAAALAVLAQACEATAALIGNGAVLSLTRPELCTDVGALLEETLLSEAPLRVMRRVSPDGETVVLDLDAASRESEPGLPPVTFGSGLRPCPGEAQARGLARGVLEALLARGSVVADGIACVVSPVFRMPARVEATLDR
jgi:cytochrome P450